MNPIFLTIKELLQKTNIHTNFLRTDTGKTGNTYGQGIKIK